MEHVQPGVAIASLVLNLAHRHHELSNFALLATAACGMQLFGALAWVPLVGVVRNYL